MISLDIISSYGMQLLVKEFLNSQSMKGGLGLLTFLECVRQNWPVEVMIAVSNCGALVRHEYDLFLLFSLCEINIVLRENSILYDHCYN